MSELDQPFYPVFPDPAEQEKDSGLQRVKTVSESHNGTEAIYAASHVCSPTASRHLLNERPFSLNMGHGAYKSFKRVCIYLA